MRRLRLAVPSLVATALLAAPSFAGASPWYINGKIFNNTGSTAQNCYGTTGVGCVTTPPGDIILDDASYVSLPTSPIASGNTGTFSFQANQILTGADMYAQYVMPDNSSYMITAEDDEGSGGTSGNYAACSQTSAQGSAYVCSAQWGGSYQNTSLKYTLGPSGNAPVPSAGQICSGEMGGGSPITIDCTQTGQFGPTDPNNRMVITVASEIGGGMYISDTANGNNCRVYDWAQQCTIYTSGTGPDHIIIGTLSHSTASWFGVQIVGAADGLTPPNTVPTWPPNDSSVASPRPELSSLAIAPGIRSGGAGARGLTRLGVGQSATITYRDNREATTVFAVARAVSGVRRGSPRWQNVGPSTVQSSATFRGVSGSPRCHPVAAGPLTPPGERLCVWRTEISGHFAHRDRRGNNVVRFIGQVDGRPLSPGLYRLTAFARGHSTTTVSAPVSVRFLVGR
jgi:hypothetical protein